MTLKEFIDYFIMKEEHNTEINISIRETDHALVP